MIVPLTRYISGLYERLYALHGCHGRENNLSFHVRLILIGVAQFGSVNIFGRTQNMLLSIISPLALFQDTLRHDIDSLTRLSCTVAIHQAHYLHAVPNGPCVSDTQSRHTKDPASQYASDIFWKYRIDIDCYASSAPLLCALHHQA